jgi:Coenzyme PQQ synthesis protein D (PqqD)
MKSDLSHGAPGGDARFAVRDRQVIHRIIDDEVVMIDLETGNYFTFRGSATRMWACIEAGMSSRETLEHLQESFEGDPSVMEQGIRWLLDQLLEENLIVPTDEPRTRSVSLASEGERQGYSDPAFEKYDDMADLILLDPVHEIDQEKGWPKKAPEE